MSHYGPLDWDHSGDEFDKITVMPKPKRRVSMVLQSNDVAAPVEIPSLACRKPSLPKKPSRSKRRNSSATRDAKGRFSRKEKVDKDAEENSPATFSNQPSPKTGSSVIQSAEIKRDSSSGFASLKKSGTVDPGLKSTTRKTKVPSENLTEKLEEDRSATQGDANLNLAPKAKKSKPPTKSPYFTPPLSPLKNDESEGQDAAEDEQATVLKPPKKRSPPKITKSKPAKADNHNTSPSQEGFKTRSPGGLVSCIPFPPLSAPFFGLIQEKLAQDPFRLLIAVTFLIRTHGKHAIPVFYSLMETYPTPESLAKADKDDIVPIIRHLGLQNQRASTYQMYANIWLDKPPVKGKRYAVRGYPTKDSGRNVKKDEILSDEDEREAWEIGHMTQGPYAIDSWRIFCRDVLRGEAEGWNGERSKKEGFQPEWMRVLPEDKELRAYLRWMWLKEGFDWDPFTGEKEVASPELMKAAFEGRIAWDDQGGMRVLDDVMDLQPNLSQVGNLGDVDDALMQVEQDNGDE